MNNFYSGDQDKEIPSTSNYMQFEDGDNRFRILGSFAEKTAIRGIEYWKTVDGVRKPIRLAPNADGTFPNVPSNELEVNKFGDLDKPKFFWAFPVWNFSEKRVQILEITQKTVLGYIKKVIDNPKWGDPRDYDITVTRGKEGEKTVYTVTNDPKEKLDKAIIDAYISTNIKMQALFTGDDPFDSNGAVGEEYSADDIANDAVSAGI